MDRCSFFIPNKALFGSFPSQQTVDLLEEKGVRVFVDLTDSGEYQTVPYQTKYKYINYPIEDRQIPTDWKSFAQLIIEISRLINDLDEEQMIYIHCRGGHGRSGILVACILCYHLNLSPDDAIHQTSRFHSLRPELKDKWKRLGSPQGKKQKDFVRRFFRPLYFGHQDNEYTTGLNNNSNHSVTINGITFPNAGMAFQSFRTSSNSSEYIGKLLKNEFDPSYVKANDPSWEEHKVEYMYKVLKYKFSQHPLLRYNLLNTGLRPLVKVSMDSFWGNGNTGDGRNLHGKIISKIRECMLIDDFTNKSKSG